MALRVDEIFESIQGEGITSGYPTTFIRLYGCNLRCSYCDTKQRGGGDRMSLENILKKVREFKHRYVCITGGEPLIQDDTLPLVYDLIFRDFNVSIETNGSFLIDDSTARKYSYAMDIKCPSSNMQSRNLYSNLFKLSCIDSVKFVIKNDNDFDFAINILKKYPTKASVFFSPVMELVDDEEYPWSTERWESPYAETLCKRVLQEKQNIRIYCQMHKYLKVR